MFYGNCLFCWLTGAGNPTIYAACSTSCCQNVVHILLLFIDFSGIRKTICPATVLVVIPYSLAVKFYTTQFTKSTSPVYSLENYVEIVCEAFFFCCCCYWNVESNIWCYHFRISIHMFFRMCRIRSDFKRNKNK